MRFAWERADPVRQRLVPEHPLPHGGPEINGDLILPPVATGAETIVAARDLPAGWVAEYTARCVDNARVYLTSSPDDAVVYAALWPDPWLYVVEPSGDLEPDPDLARGAGHWIKHVRCASAIIRERQRLPQWLVDEARADLLDWPLVRRAPGSKRWAPSTDDWNRLRPPTFGDLIDACA